MTAVGHFGSGSSGLLRSRSLQHHDHFPITSRTRQGERGVTLSIGQLQAGAGVDQCFQRRLMPLAAVAKDDGLDRCCPVQVVDMV